MEKAPRDAELGTFTTADLLNELVSRKNIEVLVAVCFIDGSSNVDPDTMFLCGRWADGAVPGFRDTINEYLDDCEEEEWEGKDGDEEEE